MKQPMSYEGDNIIDFLPIELFAELKNMGFNIDIAVLLDAYEQAYGMAWLEQFYIDNESELQKLF